MTMDKRLMLGFTEPLLAALVDREEMGKGGQELILPEIMACLASVERLWLPFYGDGVLAAALENAKIECVSARDDFDYSAPKGVDAVYFGTPTIVDNQALFPDSVEGVWYKERERTVVRRICKNAILGGVSMIVSGLGSGDIDTDERLADMGGGRIVAMKDFGEFKDWVLVRRLA